MDGSSKFFVEALEKAGIKELSKNDPFQLVAKEIPLITKLIQ